VTFWRRQSDPDLERQREFLRNCVEQIDALEARVNESRLATLQREFAAVWIDEHPTRELPGKVALARQQAADLGEVLSSTRTALHSMWTALDQLQAIIDHIQRGAQDLVAGLIARQGAASMTKANNAQG
jgi:phage gp37-like protein